MVRIEPYADERETRRRRDVLLHLHILNKCASAALTRSVSVRSFRRSCTLFTALTLTITPRWICQNTDRLRRSMSSFSASGPIDGPMLKESLWPPPAFAPAQAAFVGRGANSSDLVWSTGLLMFHLICG